MKNLFAVVGLAILTSITPLMAASQFAVICNNGTAINAGTNYCVIPAEGLANGGDAILTFISCRGFSANPITLQSYYSTNRLVLVSSNSLGANNSNIFTGTTTNYFLYQTISQGLPAVGGFVTNTLSNPLGILAGSVMVLSHLNPVTYRTSDEYLTAALTNSAFVTTTNTAGTVEVLWPIVYNQTPAYIVNDGDLLYLETAGGAISIASSATTPTTFSNQGGVLSGGRNKPFLLTIASAGAGTNTIDAVTTQGVVPLSNTGQVVP